MANRGYFLFCEFCYALLIQLASKPWLFVAITVYLYDVAIFWDPRGYLSYLYVAIRGYPGLSVAIRGYLYEK